MHQKQAEAADKLEIVYYTDPLCCWSWAFEPQWRRFRWEFEAHISCEYRMGGLLPDWDSYNDQLNSITRPFQMGALWMQANKISGMPVNDRLWIENPPSSSYPSCIAVKCAQLQSHEAGEAYLGKLREAVMLRATDISNNGILMQLALELNNEIPEIFNFKIFKTRFLNKAGLENFKQDLQIVRYHNINRFPTLTFSKKDKQSIMIVGYRPYDVLLEGISQIAPELMSQRRLIDPALIAAYSKNIPA
jgi:putative protein-disulfide isomerase